jgi:hypothetical protein
MSLSGAMKMTQNSHQNLIGGAEHDRSIGLQSPRTARKSTSQTRFSAAC